MLYADDITITSTHTSMSAARKYIQPYLHKVYHFMTGHRLTCAWQYFGTLIFELFFEIIRFYVDNINFLFLC